MPMQRSTTRPRRPVHDIEDIRAIETLPYDEVVPSRNIYDLFLATAASVGDKKALTVLNSPNANDVGLTLTHRGLLQEVTGAANMFRGLGIEPESGPVAFLCPTLPEFPVLLFGAQVAGVASPLNYLLSPEGIADLLTAEGARVLVIPARSADEMCWNKALEVVPQVKSLTDVVVLGEAEDLPDGFTSLAVLMQAAERDHLDFQPSDDRDTVCAMFHTGGTTGQPKLVRLTHGNQIHAAFGFAQVFGYDECDVVLNGFPFFHVGGTMTVGLSVLAAGGHDIIPSPYGLRPREVIENYWQLVHDFGATVVNGVPTSIGAISNTWMPELDLSSVRMAVTGGAIMPPAVGEHFMTKTGIKICETYGMTETAAAIAFNPAYGTAIAGSAGIRAPYSEIRIVLPKGDGMCLCGPGESGLVQVRGPQVFHGYFDPKHNRGTLDDQGWLTTGDLGYLNDGERLILTGREKDLIVRSGHNIDPTAIEEIADRFEGIAESAAVAMPDAYAGEVPALFLVAHTGMQVDPAAFAAFLETHIHERPAFPKCITFIDKIPVTAVGKVFKPRLLEMAIEEKVRIETELTCGTKAAASVSFKKQSKGPFRVNVRVSGATAAGLQKLREALEPLVQDYLVEADRVAPTDDAVMLKIEGRVATLTLNRPEAMNAMSQELIAALDKHVTALAERRDLRAVIITGNGRAFSAGGDLIEFEQALLSGGTTLVDYMAGNQAVFQKIENLPMVVIAAVGGVAVAGGLELLLCCDLVIAARGVRIGDGHARFAILPTAGATVRLPERIGSLRAAEMFYTGKLVDVETLQQWGLVNEVIDNDALLPRVADLAEEVSDCSPEAVRMIKELTHPSKKKAWTRSDRLKAEIEAFERHMGGRDLAVGLKAFREKNIPEY